MHYHNLQIIGTSHIAEQSIKEIQKAFEEPPTIVALELDKNRLYSLIHPEVKKAGFFEISKVAGVRGALFAVIARWAQGHFGKQVGIERGSDMLTAFKLAHKHKAKLALIDQPIELTLQNLSREFTFREKALLVWDIIRSPFGGEKMSIDLRKVPEKKLISELLEKLKIRYPSLYKVLVEDRNRHMARRLRVLMDSNPTDRILAVIGAGHAEGVSKILRASESTASHSWSVEPHNI
ncbi:MAG: TraB/GumN family protein [Nanoarchaeota archaeon]